MYSIFQALGNLIGSKY